MGGLVHSLAKLINHKPFTAKKKRTQNVLPQRTVIPLLLLFIIKKRLFCPSKLSLRFKLVIKNIHFSGFFGEQNLAFFPHKKNDFDTYTKYFMWKIGPNSPYF